MDYRFVQRADRHKGVCNGGVPRVQQYGNAHFTLGIEPRHSGNFLVPIQVHCFGRFDPERSSGFVYALHPDLEYRRFVAGIDGHGADT